MNINLQKILEDVNKIRRALAVGEGKLVLLSELPRGVPRDGQECVLARALSGAWSCEADTDGLVFYIGAFTFGAFTLNIERVSEALIEAGFTVDSWSCYCGKCAGASCGGGEIYMITPNHFADFIEAFDAGRLPKLILGDKDV